MFSGIIEKIGKVRQVRKKNGRALVEIEFSPWRNRLKIGESIAVDGTCLTVIKSGKRFFQAEVVKETLACTTLGQLQPRGRVNLERSLKLNDRLGGHLVSGHIDGKGVIVKKLRHGRNFTYQIKVPQAMQSFLIPKGSIAVDGISLTLQKVLKNTFEVAIIPHTAYVTCLGRKEVGHSVNLEADLVVKQIDQYLKRSKNRSKH
ncbi:MAG: riboflavin synthase [Candidatus Omnitrophica bacterium CG11_big_fil_rev_8_21_14_0_20_45_26]|uniref:Riboflavin synthase n=1 Tax=Candidatus Abzuiibacterium crystallinum TaxID=1974748 RepID=A0A2H0LMF0_9BACT|nr:MAG: riboflavin synthase [Candidatus Omnitrophica bacterium CG11_big_fil_rev_8_21_14_0_20_45_26]PIW65141.1 MAG: riboflavin synthase [Candidatus Omnitrophica bacterium CG12_big_fil_rev_8_21_14_0_65_45_16]